MADATHIDILCEGIEAWNEWRRKNPGVKPSLVGEDLSEGICGEMGWRRFGIPYCLDSLRSLGMTSADVWASNLPSAEGAAYS